MKLKLYNTCILPIFVYGSDWEISKTDARKIGALDQCCLLLLLGIKWYQFVRNDDVRRLTKQPELTAIIQSCQLTLFGHYAHGRQCRCQEDPVSLPSGRLALRSFSFMAETTTIIYGKYQFWVQKNYYIIRYNMKAAAIIDFREMSVSPGQTTANNCKTAFSLLYVSSRALATTKLSFI